MGRRQGPTPPPAPVHCGASAADQAGRIREHPGAHDVIVIGASAGGVEALIGLFRSLPRNLPAAVLVVLHVGDTGPSILHELLARASPLQVGKAIDGEPLLPGRAYTASPGNHLTVEPGRVRVLPTAKDGTFRPSVDVLFRSAALTYGRRVVGIVLSGTMHDGTDGLRHISAAGGISVVQDPAQAAFDGMPEYAIAHDHVRYCLPVRRIAELLVRLTAHPEGRSLDPSPEPITP
jgi:two-component system chemotaxis response regulator CheB